MKMWSQLQNWIGLILILGFFIYPNSRYVFVFLALWILTSTTMTALFLKARFTIANFVTFSRALGLAICSFILAYNESISPLLLFLLGICLLADALDGYLARRFTSSLSGGILDGETDQQFVFFTATACYLFIHASFWLLLFPALKYISEIISNFSNLNIVENIGEKRRKFVAAIVMSILFINLTSLMDRETSVLVTSLGFVLLLYSFSVDIIRSFIKKISTKYD